MNDIQRVDGSLDRLLREAGSILDTIPLRELIRGVLGAPPPLEPDAWMSLVAPRIGPELKQQLRDLHARMAAVLDDGLDGRRSDPERLRSLRVELKRRGLDGFIVPRSDEHQGEYVARRSERLAWLTGFSGSAGIAIVLKRKAAVFVDGRYTLQGIAEIDLGLYELHHLVDEPPSDWVGANLPEGAKLGYDPWLMAPAQLLRFQRACKAAGGELVPTNGNPIDAIWTNQPRPPLSPIVVHDARFTGSTSTERRQTVAKSVAAEKLDAVVLTSPDSIAWLLNIRGNDVPYAPLALSFAVLYADATVEFFVDPRKVLPGLDRHFGKAVRIQGPEGLAPTLDRLGQEKKTVRLDHEKTPAWILWRLRKAGANVMRGNDPCQLPKAKKTRVELDGMRRAHVRDGASLTRFLAWIAKDARSGRLTEMAAADKLYEFRKENDNFRGPSFPTISAFGPDGAIVHYRATPKTNRKIKRGSLYLIDSGAQYLDATTDVTRTVAVGKPSAEMRDRFTRVLKGHIALATAKFPRGTTGSQIDVLARRALWEVGLDYDHGTGHGVGSYLGVHEGPQRISKVASTVPLQEGMVISNEPGYYKTGAYGIRVENLVAVVPVTGQGKTDRPLLGLETLTLAPIDTALVDPALLSDGEITWLNAYHKRVREKLRRHVDRATRGWLKRATKPIKAARRRRA